MEQIQLTITGATLEATFGADWLTLLSDDNGYKAEIRNPDYVAAQGSPTMLKPDFVVPEGYDIMEDPDGLLAANTIPNPDHVAQVGEPLMPNPVSRLDYVANLFLKKGLQAITQPTVVRMKREAKEVADAQIKQLEQGRDAVAANSTVTITE